MALGEAENTFLKNMQALHEKMVVEAENYLKKSDNSSRPVELVNMATECVRDGTYNASRMKDMSEMLTNPKKTSAEQNAARLKMDYGY